MRQDLQSYLAINPAVKDEIRKGIFEELVYQNIFTEWVKRNKKDQDADYKKNRDKAYEMIDRKLAIEAFQQDVMKNAANLVSDEEAEKYYNENKDKSGYFKQQPFVVSAGGVESEGVSFDSEKSAKDFMAKAKAAAANFANLARDIKKSVADFGAVSAQSQDVDSNVKKIFFQHAISQVLFFLKVQIKNSGLFELKEKEIRSLLHLRKLKKL